MGHLLLFVLYVDLHLAVLAHLRLLLDQSYLLVGPFFYVCCFLCIYYMGLGIQVGLQYYIFGIFINLQVFDLLIIYLMSQAGQNRKTLSSADKTNRSISKDSNKQKSLKKKRSQSIIRTRRMKLEEASLRPFDEKPELIERQRLKKVSKIPKAKPKNEIPKKQISETTRQIVIDTVPEPTPEQIQEPIHEPVPQSQPQPQPQPRQNQLNPQDIPQLQPQPQPQLEPQLEPQPQPLPQLQPLPQHIAIHQQRARQSRRRTIQDSIFMQPQSESYSIQHIDDLNSRGEINFDIDIGVYLNL